MQNEPQQMQAAFAPAALEWWATVLSGLNAAIVRDKPDAYKLSAIAPDVYDELHRELHSAQIALFWKRDEQYIKAEMPGVWSVMKTVMHNILDGGGYYRGV